MNSQSSSQLTNSQGSTLPLSSQSQSQSLVSNGSLTSSNENASQSNLLSPTKSLQSSSSNGPDAQILTKQRLQELVREVDPNEQLDEDVEDLLLQLADDFIESTVTGACQLAKHRKANTVDAKDLQLYLERKWNMWIPGFGSDELRPYKKAAVSEAHKQRLAIIKKAQKKY